MLDISDENGICYERKIKIKQILQQKFRTSQQDETHIAGTHIFVYQQSFCQLSTIMPTVIVTIVANV